MNNNAIAERYAAALFNLASEQRQEARFGSVLDDIEQIAKEHPNFLRIMKHPVVRREDKKDMLKQLFSGKVPDEVLHFLYLLVDKKRENILQDIIPVYRELLNAHNKTVITDVTTAIPMFKKTQAILQKQLEEYLGQQVVMNCNTDPDMLGGVMIKVGDRLIDGSLKTQLSEMAQNLVSKS